MGGTKANRSHPPKFFWFRLLAGSKFFWFRRDLGGGQFWFWFDLLNSRLVFRNVVNCSALPNPQHLDFIFMFDFAVWLNQKIGGKVPSDNLDAISVDVAAPSEPRPDLPQRVFVIGDVRELVKL